MFDILPLTFSASASLYQSPLLKCCLCQQKHHTGKHLDALKQIMFDKLAFLVEEMDLDYIHHRFLCQHVELHWCCLAKVWWSHLLQNLFSLHAHSCAKSIHALQGPFSWCLCCHSLSILLTQALTAAWLPATADLSASTCWTFTDAARQHQLLRSASTTKWSTSALLAPFSAFVLQFKARFRTQRSLTGKRECINLKKFQRHEWESVHLDLTCAWMSLKGSIKQNLFSLQRSFIILIYLASAQLMPL